MSDLPSGQLETPGIRTKLSIRTRWRQITSVQMSELKQLGETVVNSWFDHNIPRLGASLAFYTLLSIAPLLIVVIAIAGAVFGERAAEGQLVWQIQGLVGHDGATTVQALIRGARRPGAGLIATILGSLTLLYGASAVVTELRAALNSIWCVKPKPTSGFKSILAIVAEKFTAFAIVLGVGFLLLVSLAVNAGISALGEHFSTLLPTPELALQVLNFVLSYVVIAALFAVLYKYLPDLSIEWRDVALGAAITALLFSVGKTLIGLYLGKAGLASTYGAAGSLVVVLVWVYYSAQIFFLGAEFTQAYAQQFGSRPCDRVGKEVAIVDKYDSTETKVREDSRKPLIEI